MRAVAATCELLQEAEKFSLGQPVTTYAPQQVLSLREQKENLWLTARRRGGYQDILLEFPSKLQVKSFLPSPAARLSHANA